MPLNQRKHQLRLVPLFLLTFHGQFFLKLQVQLEDRDGVGKTCCASRDLSQKDMLSTRRKSELPPQVGQPGLHFYRASGAASMPSLLPPRTQDSLLRGLGVAEDPGPGGVREWRILLWIQVSPLCTGRGWRTGVRECGCILA